MSVQPFTSPLIADVGISLGDEGKGRLVPEAIDDLKSLTGRPDPVAMVLKINGGANAGHTCGGLKLNLFPAGVIDPSVRHLGIGAGVVADPRKFHWEAAYIAARGHRALDRLLIDQRTQVSDVSHRLLDLAWENYRVRVLGEEPRGSTGRGISPAYTEETSHFQITYQEFTGDRASFARRLRQRLDRAARTIQHVCRATPEDWREFFERLTAAELRANAETIQSGHLSPTAVDFLRFRGPEPFTFDTEAVIETYWQAGSALAGSVGEVREAVLAALHEGKSVIGEFGQSFWLDKRIGFSPNLTASHTYVPEFFQSAGIPLQPVHTIGVCKAYDTKVGTHVFHSRIPEGHPLGEQLKRIEFGTSTGRQRMVGWYDAVEKGDALRYGGAHDLMINKLDALGYAGEWAPGAHLQVCTGYRDPAGHLLRHVPRDPGLHRSLSPVFRSFPGWSGDLAGVRHWADLPENARAYVAGILQATFEVAYEGRDWPRPLPRLRYLGVGPLPGQIIRDTPPSEALLAP